MRPALLALVAVFVLAGCAPLGAPVRGAQPLRLSELLDDGDPERRSSQALVVQGLDADADARPDEALGDYLSALRVDPGNPWAYLALARQSVEENEPQLALEYVARAEDLLEAESDALSPGAEAHLDGLRGAALVLEGERVQGNELLEQAAQRAPDVWGDARLEAAELR